MARLLRDVSGPDASIDLPADKVTGRYDIFLDPKGGDNPCPEGEKGDPGEDGKDGKNGKDGKDGKKGDKGDKGERGRKGMKGDQGVKGDQGDTGADGKDGTDFDAAKALAVSAALSMPTWLQQNENFAIAGGFGFSDDSGAFGGTAVMRLDKNVSTFAGGAVSTEDSNYWAGKAGVRVGW